MENLKFIVNHFDIAGSVESIRPLGNGLINDTFLVKTDSETTPDYVLQRINNSIFTDVDGLQRNVEAVTSHIRRKLRERGVAESELDRRVLHFINVKDSDKTYFFDGESYWRMSVFVRDALTHEEVNPHFARHAGRAFGEFQSMLTDIEEPLVETIPNFHNMEFRLEQLREAVEEDRAGRVGECRELIADLERRAEKMTAAERLYREGKLAKRICHCDTKVNNMMFDAEGNVLCVIDLDTVMPSFVFSDYGDFLRTGACTSAEDEPDLSLVNFNMEIFRAFTEGYLESAGSFLTPLEKEMLPWGAELFPYMQAVRFLTDYLNDDVYYKIRYPEHNLVRTRAQIKMLESVEAAEADMAAFVEKCLQK